jgi:hypothetical protein
MQTHLQGASDELATFNSQLQCFPQLGWVRVTCEMSLDKHPVDLPIWLLWIVNTWNTKPNFFASLLHHSTSIGDWSLRDISKKSVVDVNHTAHTPFCTMWMTVMRTPIVLLCQHSWQGLYLLNCLQCIRNLSRGYYEVPFWAVARLSVWNFSGIHFTLPLMWLEVVNQGRKSNWLGLLRPLEFAIIL